MANLHDIYEYINSVAPFGLQDKFDNSGLIIDSGREEVTKVLLALDATKKVIDEAYNLGCELIITHHPVIFHPLKELDVKYPAPYMFSKGISCISAHTNLDSADYDISDMMVELLGMTNTGEILSVNRSYEGKPVGYGRFATCECISADDLAKLCKERFNSRAVKYTPGCDRITRVAVCSGAGGSMIYEADVNRFDALVTADVKHDQFLEAELQGKTIIDCGHYETEVIAMPYLYDILSEKFPEVKFFFSAAMSNTIKAI